MWLHSDAAIVRVRRTLTVQLMPRSLDSRRTLTPIDYISSSYDFGQVVDAPFLIPDGGDILSMRRAQVQHRIATIWNGERNSRDTAILARRWDCSVHVLYRAAHGTRWASATVLSALLESQLSGLEMPTPSGTSAS